MFELDGDIIAGIDVESLCVISLIKQLGLLASVTYIHSTEAAPSDPLSQSIFTGNT